MGIFVSSAHFTINIQPCRNDRPVGIRPVRTRKILALSLSEEVGFCERDFGVCGGEGRVGSWPGPGVQHGTARRPAHAGDFVSLILCSVMIGAVKRRKRSSFLPPRLQPPRKKVQNNLSSFLTGYADARIEGGRVIVSGGVGRKKVGYNRPVGIEARGSAGVPIVVPTRLDFYSM